MLPAPIKAACRPDTSEKTNVPTLVQITCVGANCCCAGRALLQRMAPEHKFATAAKLCGEVLGGVADGLLPLHQCEEVLGDALRCLASKDIKVGFTHCQAGCTLRNTG